MCRDVPVLAVRPAALHLGRDVAGTSLSCCGTTCAAMCLPGGGAAAQAEAEAEAETEMGKCAT